MAYIDITPVSGRVVVRWRGHVVIDTDKALELREGSYPPVLYLPREDADMALLTVSPRHTTCPHKGVASYYNFAGDDNAVWSYETPKPEVAAIAGRLAFYPDRVEISRNPS